MIRIRKRFLFMLGAVVLILGAAAACSLPAGNPLRLGQSDSRQIGAGDDGGAPTADPEKEGDDDAQDLPAISDGRPNAPGNLGANHQALWDVDVSWADNSDDEDGFRVYRQRLDLPTPLLMEGETGPDAGLFRDSDTLCGATYRYIVASYNEIGESPASACWEITLPPCSAEQVVEMGIGAENGYDFLARGPATPGDFYLGFNADSALTILSDQEGQKGVMDLGFLGDWPLNRVDLPRDQTYSTEPVPVLLGHTYAALARDGMSVVVFRVEELGSAVRLRALVWRDLDLIKSEACSGDPGNLVFTGGDIPGDPCISGDGVCNPACSTPRDDVLGRPVASVPEGEELTIHEVELVGDRESGDDGDTPILIEVSPVYEECANLAKSMLSDPPTAAEMAAAQAAFLACLHDHGIDTGTPGEPGRLLRERDSSDEPTFTPRDYDCDENLCVPGDGVCDPTCRDLPERYSLIEEVREVGDSDVVLRIADDDSGGLLTIDRGDIDCAPDRPNFERYCGPDRPAALTDAFTLWMQEDRNGDGTDDYFVYVDANPDSPTYRTVIEWDTLCGDRERRYVCDPSKPAEVTEDYALVSSADTNGDGLIDRYLLVNTNPDSPRYGEYLIWDTDCPDDELICSPTPPRQLTGDYQPTGSQDTDGDGQDDRTTYVNVNPDSPDYGKKITWDTLCEKERVYWCGPNVPTWLTSDYELTDSGATYRIYENTNPASSGYGNIGYWDFGPNCPGDEPNQPPPPDPCANYGGLGWEGDVCVCEGITVHVTICQDNTQFEQRTEIPCTPDAVACAPPDEPGDDDTCTCDYVCVRQAITYVGCAEYGWRDSCTGAVCKP